jgi:hypothetical protein
MSPELTTTLAARQARELTSQATARYAPASPTPLTPRRRLFPRYRITWTRISLALTDGGRPRTSSWAIVISTTRGR